uniref:Golgin-84 n=1 Tax=Macrostomum lignano TaxID=282301 RepID=A0A1I8HDI5_9PLAT
MLAHSTLLLSTAATAGGRQRLRRVAGSRRAYDGIDNAAMGSIQLSLNDPSRSRRSGDFTDQQQPQQPQLYADYRRRSLTADSDTTSLGRGRDGAKGTTPVGSYISGVLGGSLHPGLAADDLADDAEAADVQDEDAKSAADSASEAVVRLRAENARLAERLRSAEQRARQAERERLALAERALATAGELDEAREELREEQRLAAGLKRHPSESPQSPPGSSLDAELERANRRAGSLERSLQEMQRRLLLAESRQVGADNEAAAAAASDDLEAAPSTSPMDPAAALAVGAMSQAVADLRADSEALRRRAARDELARKRRLEEVEEKAADGQRASEEALLSVSLGLESARAQNAELRQLLERSEAARAGQSRKLGRLQEDFGQLQESQSGLEAWAAQVAAGREDLRQLGEANSELRARLDWLERGLDGLGAELRAARAEAARRSERCRRLAEEAARARQAEEKSGRAAAAASATLGRVAAEHRSLRRRLGAAAEAAEAAGAAKVARQLRELAGSLSAEFQRAGRQLQGEVDRLRRELQVAIEKLTDCEAKLYLAREVAGSESDSGLGDVTAEPRRRSNAQLAALIEQIDLVEARGDSLLALKRRQVQEAATPAAAQSQKQATAMAPPGGGGPPVPEDRSDMQRLLRMLLYNSGGSR